MTRVERFSEVALTDRKFVLATDLDGTFLGGSQTARATFYDWLEERRDQIGLIFVTGRDPAFIETLTRETFVPRPDYVVGDVGTTIAAVTQQHKVRPIVSLEAEIASLWRASDRIRAALRDAPGLTLQETEFRYRVSYDMDPARFDDSVVTKIEALGCDVLISDNRFLDVLPKGVSKGPSLQRLLDHLGVDPHRTLVAGDTLNDLSMLVMGLPAVAVGGAEPALIDAVANMNHVFQASRVGVLGIEDAIDHHKLFT